MPSEIVDAAELRVKESDRIATLAVELGRLGVAVETRARRARRSAGGPRRRRRPGASFASHGDHRIAMAAAVAATALGGDLDGGRMGRGRHLVPRVRCAPRVRWEAHVRDDVRVVAVDGPSGSGKSTVSRAVADALGLEVLDTGAMYRAVTQAAFDARARPHRRRRPRRARARP